MPGIVILHPVEPGVALLSKVERLPQHPLNLRIVVLVPLLKAAVVEGLLDEADVLPDAGQQHPRHGKVGHAIEVAVDGLAVGGIVGGAQQCLQRGRFDLPLWRGRLDFTGDSVDLQGDSLFAVIVIPQHLG